MTRRAAQSSEFHVHCKVPFDLAMKLELGHGFATRWVYRILAFMLG